MFEKTGITAEIAQLNFCPCCRKVISKGKISCNLIKCRAQTCSRKKLRLNERNGQAIVCGLKQDKKSLWKEKNEAIVLHPNFKAKASGNVNDAIDFLESEDSSSSHSSIVSTDSGNVGSSDEESLDILVVGGEDFSWIVNGEANQDQELTIEPISDQPEINQCQNCGRSKILDEELEAESPYRTVCQFVAKENLCNGATRRSYSNIKTSDCNARGLFYLCFTCTGYLTLGGNKEYNKGKWTWAAYIWKLFISTVEPCTRQKIWQMLPDIFQKQYWSSISIFFPGEVFLMGSSSVKEITYENNTYKKGLKNAKFIHVCNVVDEMLPNVKCLFGCSTYAHRCEGKHIDDVFQALNLNEVLLSRKQRESVVDVLYMRQDYINWGGESKVNIGGNEKWPVLPAIRFFGISGPMFCVCPKHKGNTGFRYFHAPQSPIAPFLPAPISDQVAPACIRSRILKGIKKSMYNTTYETLELRGQFGGIDSCFITTSNDFKTHSDLLQRNEIISMIGRKEEMEAILQLKITSGDIDSRTAFSKLEAAKNFNLSQDMMDSSLTGATFMSLSDCVRLQEDINRNNVTLGSTLAPVPWPLNRTFVHPVLGEHGAMPAIMPSLCCRDVSTRGVWLFLSMVAFVPELWRIVGSRKENYLVDDWEAHFLSLATKECLPYCYTQKKIKNFRIDMPVKQKVRKISAVSDKFELEEMKSKLLELPHVHYVIHHGCSTTQSLLDQRSVFGVTVLVFIVDQVMESEEYFQSQIQSLSGDIYELRAVCTECLTGGGVDDWTATVYGRHGGKRHHGWWKNRRKDIVSTTLNDLHGIDIRSIKILVYVKSDEESVGELTAKYLEHSGCQSRVFCGKHYLPLCHFPCPRRCHQLKCYQLLPEGDPEFCNRKCDYHCPVEGCCTFICRRCLGSHDEGSRYLLQPKLGSGDQLSREIANLFDVRMSENGAHCENFDTCELGEDRRPLNTALNFDIQNDFVDGLEPDDAGFADPSNFDEERHEHAGPDHCMGITTNTVQCTNASNIPATIEPLDPGNSNPLTLPGHVVLNQCGTLLIRNGSSLHGNRTQQAILNKVACTCAGVSIPTMYLEGMLFPSIFWHSLDHGATISGAIPSPLLAQQKRVRGAGFATLEDHVQCRITSFDCLSGVDHRYKSFLYDAMANVHLNGRHSKVVVHRGFHDTSRPKPMMDSSRFLSSAIASKRIISELAASEKSDPSTLFLTITANQMNHPGLRRIRRFINFDSAGWFAQNYKQILMEATSESEFKAALDTGLSTVLLRNWLEFCDALAIHLENRTARTLGKVLKFFIRYEYQDGKGNLCHLHILICTKEKPFDQLTREKLENMIAACSGDIVKDAEVPRLIRQKLLEDMNDYYGAKDQALKFLGHECSERCLRRTGVGENDLECRVPDVYHTSPNPTKHMYVKKPIQHVDEAWAIFCSLDLATLREFGEEQFEATSDLLECIQHYPPCLWEGKKFSPFHRELFLCLRGNQNLQIVHKHHNTKYLVKYVVKIDENNRVFIGVDKKDENKFLLDQHFLHNTKIDSSRRNEHYIMNKRRKHRYSATSKTFMEIEHTLLGVEMSRTNMEYVHISTKALEERVGVEVTSGVKEINNIRARGGMGNADNPADIHEDEIEALQARNALTESRKFTPMQILMAKDYMFSNVSVDKLTLFSLRPPEILLWLKKPDRYFRWFQIKTVSKEKWNINEDLKDSSWIDALGNEVRLRSGAYQEVLEYLDQILDQLPRAARTLISHLKNLCKACKCYHWGREILDPCLQQVWHSGRLYNVVLESRLPIPVFPHMLPNKPAKFLIHLLYSLGEYDTELELLAHSTFRDCFRHAGLIQLDENGIVDEESVNGVLKNYLTQQLFHYPLNTRCIDNNTIASKNVIKSAIVDNLLLTNDMPACLFTACIENVSDKCTEFLANVKHSMAVALHISLQPLHDVKFFPSIGDLDKVSRDVHLPYEGTILQGETQTEESFDEQLKSTSEIRLHIDQYLWASDERPRCVLLNGSPGVGKTFNMMYSGLMAACKGLTVLSTALLSDRASALGGIHIHKLAKLKPGVKNPSALCDSAVTSLLRSPELLHLLLSIDVLLFDEVGQNSAQIFSALEMIFRTVRQRNDFFGGVLIFGTIDEAQLKPISGIPVLTSPHMLTSFDVISLRHCVRAEDEESRRLVNLIRTPSLELRSQGKQREEIKSILRRKANWVSTWQDPAIPVEAVRVFGRKKPARKECNRCLQLIKDRCLANNQVVLECKSKDEQVPLESHTGWQTANERVSLALDRNVREPRLLMFYEGATFESTVNNPAWNISYSQLLLLFEMPRSEQVLASEAISMLCAPNGVKTMPNNVSCKKDYIDRGWREVQICPLLPHCIRAPGNMRGRRHQYPIRPRLTATIHQVMGSTLGRVATRITMREKEYSLWEKGQVVVLLSRTKLLEHLTFVGDKEDTLNAIVALLCKRSLFDDYVSHVLSILTGESSTFRPAALPRSVYRVRDCQQVEGSTGLCYMLMSTRNNDVTYVGKTERALVTRLREHNNGTGSVQTGQQHLLPWTPIACVCGFDGVIERLNAFEVAWEYQRNFRATTTNTTPISLADTALEVIEQTSFANCRLRYIRFIEEVL